MYNIRAIRDSPVQYRAIRDSPGVTPGAGGGRAVKSIRFVVNIIKDTFFSQGIYEEKCDLCVCVCVGDQSVEEKGGGGNFLSF